MCNSNCITQYQVRPYRGVVGSATSTTLRQCKDWIPIGDEYDRGDSHALKRELKSMYGRGREKAQVQDIHFWSRGGRVSDCRCDKLWA